MKITTDPPTEPGYYLRRDSKRWPWKVWGLINVGDHETLRGLQLGSEHLQRPAAVRGEWLGPFDLDKIVELLVEEDDD